MKLKPYIWDYKYLAAIYCWSESLNFINVLTADQIKFNKCFKKG